MRSDCFKFFEEFKVFTHCGTEHGCKFHGTELRAMLEEGYLNHARLPNNEVMHFQPISKARSTKY